MIYTETEEYVLNGKRQNLPGFNGKYANFVDYILKITEEIWEERAIWVIHETYTEDIVFHVGARSIKGRDKIVNGTLKTLSAFPDRKMGGEAVIWSKLDDNNFYSSHRIGSTATNLGKTDFGPATGQKVCFRTIADCMVTENRIYEEWLVRDNLHLIQQLGFDPVEMAKRDKRYQGMTITLPKDDGSDITLNGRVLDLNTPNDLIISMFEQVWKTKDFSQLHRYYHPIATIHAICDNDIIGPRILKNYLENLMASFPDAKVTLERISSNLKGNITEVAARWKIAGLHKGNGFFSPASGKPIILPVITHYIISRGKIVEEWMVFDAFDVLCMIYADTPPNSSPKPVLNGLYMPTLGVDGHLKHKKMVVNFFNALNKSTSKKAIQDVFSKHLSENITLNITKPYETINGITAYLQDFWLPLQKAFPDLETQPYILIGGAYEGRDYVSCTGNFIGTFKETWHGIPPTHQPTWLRYAGHFMIENGKIVKAWYFFDMLDVMRQAGFHFFPNKGIEWIPPAPMTGDGMVTYKTNPIEGQKTLDLVSAMLTALGEYDGETLASMDQTRFWDVKNMMWYGPSGIGTTRGLRGFETYHQLPFLQAFPNRGMLKKGGEDHFTRFGDGHYACDFGFPMMYGTHKGNTWLGLAPTGVTFTLRVIDYWRREGSRLKENWVFIDMIDVLEQFGIDVFKMLEERINS